MAASPTCTVANGAGAAMATTNGVVVTAGNTITVSLASITGVNSWTLTVVGQDDMVVAPLLSVNTTTKIALFIAPALPWAIILRSVVNGGTDVNGIVQASLTTTFKICCLTSNGQRLASSNETLENNSLTGWTSILNSGPRTAAASNPSGTGFVHITAGTQDGASRAVNVASSADVSGILTIANGGTGVSGASGGFAAVSTVFRADSGGVPAFGALDATASTAIVPDFGAQNVKTTSFFYSGPASAGAAPTVGLFRAGAAAGAGQLIIAGRYNATTDYPLVCMDASANMYLGAKFDNTGPWPTTIYHFANSQHAWNLPNAGTQTQNLLLTEASLKLSRDLDWSFGTNHTRALNIQINSATIASFLADSSALAMSKPILGSDGSGITSPYGAHGQVIKAFPSDANYTVLATEYKYDHLRFNVGSWLSGHTVTFPAAASDAAAYGKTIWNNSGFTMTISSGTGTKTLATGLAQRFWIDATVGVNFDGPTFTP